MAGYIDYDVQVDTAAIVEQTVNELRAATGAAVNEGHPLVALAEVVAHREAETRIAQAHVAAAIFRDFGQKIVGVAPLGAYPASAPALFIVADDAGYTIPEGTRVLYPVTGSQRVAFATESELIIPPGSLSATTDVFALVHGDAANGLPAGTVTLVDQLDVPISSIATTDTTSGGADAETPLEYLDRLAAELRLLSLVPRLIDEFEAFAKRIAGVYRARAIKGYDADTSTADVPGHVTVAVVDEDGAAVSSAAKAEVEAELTSDGKRALNVVVHVIDPTLQAVEVDFTAVADDDADPVTVEAAAIAAVEDYLNPGAWAGGDETPPAWRDAGTVRYLEVAAVLDRVDGLDYITALTLDGGTADVPLLGVGVLPDPTVTGTVS